MPDQISDSDIRARRAQLASLNAEISERAKYRREQEKVIGELVESGNTRLLGLNYEITVKKKELRDLKTDIRITARDKKELEATVAQMRKQATDEFYGTAGTIALV